MERPRPLLTTPRTNGSMTRTGRACPVPPPGGRAVGAGDHKGRPYGQCDASGSSVGDGLVPSRRRADGQSVRATTRVAPTAMRCERIVRTGRACPVPPPGSRAVGAGDLKGRPYGNAMRADRPYGTGLSRPAAGQTGSRRGRPQGSPLRAMRCERIERRGRACPVRSRADGQSARATTRSPLRQCDASGSSVGDGFVPSRRRVDGQSVRATTRVAPTAMRCERIVRRGRACPVPPPGGRAVGAGDHKGRPYGNAMRADRA